MRINDRKYLDKYKKLIGDEIPKLIEAYEFAQENELSEENLFACHTIFSKNLLVKSKRGKHRIEPVGVLGTSGITYLAVEPEFVSKEMKAFFDDLNNLITSNLSEIEVFYFA